MSRAAARAGSVEVLLRAERFAPEGRTYAADVRLGDGGQVVFAAVEVHVRHEQGR